MNIIIYSTFGGEVLDSIIVNGVSRLSGSINIQGSKNAALPIIAATLLNEGISVIENVPDIDDVRIMLKLLQMLGCNVIMDDNTCIIDSKMAVYKSLPSKLTDKLRASQLLLGAMTARFGRASMGKPGGCRIGKRPLDIHMHVFSMMGAYWENSDEEIRIICNNLHGNDIFLRFPSVGATENAVILAVGATGNTYIRNAAKEPEVVELCEFLKGMGASIKGAGSDVIEIDGRKELSDTAYKVSGDRIVAGTYLTGICMCTGEVKLRGIKISDCKGFIDIFTGMGMDIRNDADGINARMEGRPLAINYIETGPYPKTPTDMQPMLMAALAVADGDSIIKENVFENRLNTAYQLNLMGADINVEKDKAFIRGVKGLKGTDITAGDLRGAAALLLAAIAADGTTVIDDIGYLFRGYENIVDNFTQIGALISLGR